MKEITKLPALLSQNVSTHLKTKREPLYSVRDIASLTGMTVNMVNYRIMVLGVEAESKTQTLSENPIKSRKLYKVGVIALVKGYKEK